VVNKKKLNKKIKNQMYQMLSDIFGYIGGGLINIASLIQLIKIIKNKSAKDISIITYSILEIANIMWFYR